MKTKTTLLLIITFFIISCTQTQQCEPTICFEETCYEIEIPRTQEEKQQGLMFREHLQENQGMLFIFNTQQKHAFWMKNTLIPLDMIWLNEDLEVVYIQTATPCEEEPCKIYAPTTEALYTLEINAGLAEQNNIKIETQAKLELCE
ncbi:DUF192 domain-containing protein [Candidatus Woesearchaeota archaeon]|nr:DUF192 domain-containing protein [Candidatus Woesearchaeota archaeon]